MFHAFELQPEIGRGRQRLTVAFVAATVILGGLLSSLVLLTSSRPLTVPPPKQVDVAFRPLPPPPPPAVEIPVALPPPPVAKARKPAPASPSAAAAKAPAPMVAPAEVPPAPPPESDTAVAAVAVEVGGTGSGLGRGSGNGDADENVPAVAAPTRAAGPISLPEEAEPPEPADDNAQPEYPESARASGQEAKVVLKVVVELDGHVGRVVVLKGQEPFVSAAIAAVKAWTYKPATLDGQPLVVFKIVNITFALRD